MGHIKRNRIIEIISGLLILLFVYTAVSKLLEYNRFVRTLSQSPLIKNYAHILAWLLPLFELSIAGLLVFPRTRLQGLFISSVLMLVFSSYVAYMLLSVTHLPCSCGGVLNNLTWKEHLVFNLASTLVAIIGWSMQRKSARSEKMIKVQCICMNLS